MYKPILLDLHVVVFESIMVVTFLERWIQLAPHFSISFFICLMMFLKYLVFVGQVLYGRVRAEGLLLSICGAEWRLDSTGSGLFLVVGLLMWNVNCGWQTLCGEGDGPCREGNDDSKAVHVCINYSAGFSFHLLLFFWSSKRLGEVGKLGKCGMLFYSLPTAFKGWGDCWCGRICSCSVRYLTGLYLNMLKMCTAATEVLFESCHGIAQIKGNHAFKL